MGVENRKFAMLIDAENISSDYIKTIFEEIEKYGTIVYKRIYADWENQGVNKNWKLTTINYAIKAVQNHACVSKKNSSDSVLIIDAMDILYSNKVDAFCLVTSDSDFRVLAMRLRESEMYVLGMGEEKTVPAFKNACDKFISLDVIRLFENQDKKDFINKSFDINAKEKFIIKINRIIDDTSNEEGWANLAEVTNRVYQLEKDFDPRKFGHTKMSNLLKDLGRYDFKNEVIDGKKLTPLYIRIKQ